MIEADGPFGLMGQVFVETGRGFKSAFVEVFGAMGIRRASHSRDR